MCLPTMGWLCPWDQFLCAGNWKLFHLTEFHRPQTKTFFLNDFWESCFLSLDRYHMSSSMGETWPVALPTGIHAPGGQFLCAGNNKLLHLTKFHHPQMYTFSPAELLVNHVFTLVKNSLYEEGNTLAHEAV